MNEEMIDIYTVDRVKTGEVVARKGWKPKPGEYMLYVLALVENADGRFLLTRRAMDKKWAAGAWEIPGGGADAGETSFEAVARELREETGLDVAGMERECCYSYRNDDPESGDYYFCDVYYFRMDFDGQDLSLQDEEVTGARMVAEEDFAALHERDGLLHFERIQKVLAKLRADGVRR